MKHVLRQSIVQQGANLFEQKMLFDILTPSVHQTQKTQIICMRDLLLKRKNESILEKLTLHPAMWSEVFRPEDELEIFTEICDWALASWVKTHIIGLTLGQEIEFLEKYYTWLWYFREDTNTFQVDYTQVLISGSCYVENLMWRGSDYKRMWKKIFFCPPIREAGQVKNLFRGINRWSLAGIIIENLTEEVQNFLEFVVLEEHILPLHLGRVLKYNFEDLDFSWEVTSTTVAF
jgi:hypothetical protein